MEFFLVYGSIFGSAITHTLQNIRGVAPGLFIFEFFTGLWLSIPTFYIKGYDYDKRFVCVLVLSVINTGCPKNSVQTMLRRDINVCTGGDL